MTLYYTELFRTALVRVFVTIYDSVHSGVRERIYQCFIYKVRMDTRDLACFQRKYMSAKYLMFQQ